MGLLLLLLRLSVGGDAPLVIEHVSVVPMDREIVLPDHTLVVAEGRIVALGPADEVGVAERALRIDGRGRYVMPGLADMHVHCWDENDLWLFVAGGVTTVRNLFGSPRHLEWRARIAAGELVGPRIYTAGPIVDGAPTVWPGSLELSDPAQAARIAREQREAGYDFLKPYARLSRACYEALAAAGRAEGLPLMGHVPDAIELADVLAAGQVTIEHLDGFAEAAQRPGTPWTAIDFTNEAQAWQEVSEERLARVAARVRAAGAWTCPTLIVRQKWALGEQADAHLARPEMRYVSPLQRASWDPRSPWCYLSRLPESQLRAAHAALPFQQLAVRALRDAGAPLLLGTDMGNPFVVAGFALHEELELLVDAGLTPYEALRAGTAEAALCMGAEEQWGTLAVGRRADLLLLEADPLADVRHARERAGVVLNGRWLAEDELQAELERRARRFEASASGAQAERGGR